MKSIVVPVNFSACADNAARYAANLALILHTDVNLIHVIQVPVSSAEMTMTEYVYQEMVESANFCLNKLKADLTRHTNGKVNINTHLEAGSIAAKVKNLCRELDTYAVVLGTTGPSVEKFLTGSPISSLLSNLPYPVLAIPDNVEFLPFRRIALACDLDDIGTGILQSLPLLRDIRQRFNPHFDVITVETPAIKAKEEYVFECDAWKSSMKEFCPDHHFVHGDTVQEGVQQYLRENKADLVIVFPKKHSLFEFHASQSKKLTKHSPVPVLSVHE